jgi:chromosome segregation ATPase
MAGENINRRLNIYINEEVVNSLSGITREMGKTRNELKNLNKNSADYDSDVARLTKHLSDLNEKQEFREELKLTNKEMNAAQENFSNLLGGLATGDMKAVQEGLMGIRFYRCEFT